MFHKISKQYSATKFLLLALAATSFGAYAASIGTRDIFASFHDGMIVASSDGFYDDTNNRPRVVEAPNLQLPPPIVCSNNCTISSNPFPGKHKKHSN